MEELLNFDKGTAYKEYVTSKVDIMKSKDIKEIYLIINGQKFGVCETEIRIVNLPNGEKTYTPILQCMVQLPIDGQGRELISSLIREVK